MTDHRGQRRERVRRLLRALYREEVCTGAYRVYRRRLDPGPARTMLDTFLRVEDRVISRLEGHLAGLGVGRPERRGSLRRALGWLGAGVGELTALGGRAAILRRVRGEEWRGAERYGREAEWSGWSAAERETLEGHGCDQRFQHHWAEDVAREPDGRPPPGIR